MAVFFYKGQIPYYLQSIPLRGMTENQCFVHKTMRCVMKVQNIVDYDLDKKIVDMYNKENISHNDMLIQVLEFNKLIAKHIIVPIIKGRLYNIFNLSINELQDILKYFKIISAEIKPLQEKLQWAASIEMMMYCKDLDFLVWDSKNGEVKDVNRLRDEDQVRQILKEIPEEYKNISVMLKGVVTDDGREFIRFEKVLDTYLQIIEFTQKLKPFMIEYTLEDLINEERETVQYIEEEKNTIKKSFRGLFGKAIPKKDHREQKLSKRYAPRDTKRRHDRYKLISNDQRILNSIINLLIEEFAKIPSQQIAMSKEQLTRSIMFSVIPYGKLISANKELIDSLLSNERANIHETIDHAFKQNCKVQDIVQVIMLSLVRKINEDREQQFKKRNRGNI